MPGRVWERALEVAADQHGFITFEDLRELDADPALLRQWHQRGRIGRVGHGIYRFRHVPASPLDPYMLASLWPAGRGVLSHVTALELYELCDVNPAQIHITLPPGYRPRRKGGDHYVVHHEQLTDDDITWYEGIRIVTPTVAIRQALETHVPTQLVRQAIANARRLGLSPSRVLDDLSRHLEDRA